MGGGTLSDRFVSMGVPAGNGAGPSIDVSKMIDPKSLYTKGTWLGGVVVAIQSSMDGVAFDEVATFTGPDQIRILDDSVRFLRSFVFGFAGGTPSIDVGGVEDEEWLNLLRKGQCFMTESFNTPLPAFLAHSQIFNPAGSGIRVLVRSVNIGTLTGENTNLARFDTALTALSAFVPENLLGGGPAAIAEIRNEGFAAATGSRFGLLVSRAVMMPIRPPQGQEWIHELLPGQGMLVVNAVAGDTLILDWQWAEVPLTSP